MPEVQNNKVSPIVAIAAVSIIIFSAVGVGVMTGVIPSSLSKPAETSAPAAEPQSVATPAPAPAPAEAPKAVASTPKKKQHVASAQPAPRVAANEPPPPPPAPRICSNCGSVVSVNTVKHQGEGSGLGVVGGAVVGGVLGNQIGRGTGRTVATVVGAGAGAYAGNEVEKRAKSSQSYSVAVRMDDGSTRSFNYESEPAFRAGDKVKVVEGRLASE